MYVFMCGAACLAAVRVVVGGAGGGGRCGWWWAVRVVMGGAGGVGGSMNAQSGSGRLFRKLRANGSAQAKIAEGTAVERLRGRRRGKKVGTRGGR